MVLPADIRIKQGTAESNNLRKNFKERSSTNVFSSAQSLPAKKSCPNNLILLPQPIVWNRDASLNHGVIGAQWPCFQEGEDSLIKGNLDFVLTPRMFLMVALYGNVHDGVTTARAFPERSSDVPQAPTHNGKHLEHTKSNT